MKTMLIDAAHSEDLRVAILENGRLEDFEAETAGKQQLKGNIYIGHVSRVEPSLQAAFITYGGNRNGFLAFGEVHPQFFAVPDAEKAELLDEMAEQAARRRHLERHEDGEETAPSADKPHFTKKPPFSHARPEAKKQRPRRAEAAAEQATALTPVEYAAPVDEQPSFNMDDEDAIALKKAAALADAAEGLKPVKAFAKGGKGGRGGKPARGPQRGGKPDHSGGGKKRPTRVGGAQALAAARPRRPEASVSDELVAPVLEAVQAEESATPAFKHERSERKFKAPIHRRYRIQDVLKEGQKILVQVVKEERGSKGAALTTYFSLPGRFTVLMPNTPYAGGISRKISDPAERAALRDLYGSLSVPESSGLIIRTAGLGQEPAAIERDYANLMSLWEHIQKQFTAHDDIQCVHEDGSVIIRALRDMAGDDVGEIVISGHRAYKQAKDYARNLMPDTVKIMKEHKDDTPLFSAYNVESKLAGLHHSRVTLPSGGYLIINPTEALVSVDINSGRNTHERNIEETALKTNLEACDELARQIRLRDLAGLIVVDFIDMEHHGNIRKVENAMRKALKRDRARVQSGQISQFGLFEISRQRLRPSFEESHFITCPHCQGTGLVHSPSTAALMILRRLEETDVRGADRVVVSTSTAQVIWLLNHKRGAVADLEAKYKYQLTFKADDTCVAPDFALELITIKADGSEVGQTIHVSLREQPELPPEERYKQAKGPAGGKPEQRREGRPERHHEPRHQPEARTEDRPEPRAAEHTTTAKPGKPPRKERPVRDAKAMAAEPAQAKPNTSKPAPADAPLEVAKVVADDGDTPVIQAAPRKKFEVRKQADTDRDVPLEVANVAAEENAPKTKKAAAKTSPAEAENKPSSRKKPGILARLLGE